LALTVLEGSIDGLRHQGRPKRQWMDDIEEWSGYSAEEDVTRQGAVEKKDNRVVICSRQPSSTMVD